MYSIIRATRVRSYLLFDHHHLCLTLTLHIPPVHSISQLALPSTLEEPEDFKQDSSMEDPRPVVVVENVQLATAGSGANVRRRLHQEDVKSLYLLDSSILSVSKLLDFIFMTL
jgi:hypothetical protein